MMAGTSCLEPAFCLSGLSRTLALQGPVSYRQQAVCSSPVHACMKELRRPALLENHPGLLFGLKSCDEWRPRFHGHAREVCWQQRALTAVRASTTAPPAPSPEKEASKVDAWSSTRIPKSINEISNGENILGFGANLSADHPGYNDEEYKRRRMQIVELAKQHVPGQPVPYVEYTAAETAVWGEVLTKLEKLYPDFACKQFLDTFPLFNFKPDRVPQLQDMSEVLQQRTGWTIRPVAGLLHPRDFLNGLAFRTFHSTQYIRHGSNPMYTPEPDICHELLGHVPMLADPAFADMAYSIGLASLGASKEDCWHLTKLYWYTVEFGVIKEGEQLKAFGAGILSSFGELEWFQHGKGGQRPVFEPLDPFGKLTKMSYKDGFQKKYYVADSFEDLSAKIKEYATYLHNKNKVTSSDLSILQ